jgi:hypothetical protein
MTLSSTRKNLLPASGGSDLSCATKLLHVLLRSHLERYSAMFAVWLALVGANSLVQAQVARLMSDAKTKVDIVREIKGQVWLGTKRGVYRSEGGRFRLVSAPDLYINELIESDGEVFLATTTGAYRLEGNSFRSVTPTNLNVSAIKELKGVTWLLTDRGAFAIDRNASRRVSKTDSEAINVKEVDGQVWLLTNEEACKVVDRTPRCIRIGVSTGLNVTTILATQDINRISGQIVLATNEGLYELKGNNTRALGFKDLDINQVEEINGKTWVRTSKGAYRLDGNAARRIPDIETEVHSVSKIKGQVWLATDTGAYRIDGNSALRIPNLDTDVHGISEIQGQVWIATDSGAYRLNVDSPLRIPDIEVAVNSVELIGNEVWLATDKGAYSVDEKQSITLEVKPADSSWMSVFQNVLPKNTFLSGLVLPDAKYTKPDNATTSAKQYFEIVWETDEARFEDDLADRRYNAAERAFLPLTSGRRTIKYSVRDQWGNTFRGRVAVVVVPGPAAWLLLVSVLWIGLLLIAFSLAPISSPCHNMLMNPWFRKIGSFGIVPLIITSIPAVRRHVLRRYVRSLREDDNLNIWRQRFVVPSDELLPERFANLLLRRRTVLIIGQSGIGKTSFSRYLTSCYASKDRKRLLPGKFIPVIIHLSRYEGVSLEEMFDAELSNSGKLTDKALNSWFLRQGGFVIFIDGINEVPDATRQSVSRFVNQYWKSNLICISSQQKYAEFDWMEKFELTYLTPDKIRDVLTLRVGSEQAAIALQQFNTDTYDAYKIPQDLEFAVELLKRGQSLPKTKSDIYKATLEPLFDTWESSGQTAYSTLLFKRAFEMLSSSDAAFERAGSDLPHEIRESLSERKLIVRRGDHYHFRHDLVRAYLAAQHFAPRWAQILQDRELVVDSNWRAMLEFAILDIAEGVEVGRILFLTLERNVRLVGELFKWLNNLRPDLCGIWADEFRLKYGAAMLQ